MEALRICRQTALIFFLGCLAVAQSSKPQDYAKSAERKADANDYQGAIEDYGRALVAETNARKKEDYADSLLKVKQRFYRHLVEEAAGQSSLQAKVDLLTQAARLGVEHTEGRLGGAWVFGGKDFREVVEEGKEARKQVIFELGKRLRQAAAQKRFDDALSIHKQAYDLGPAESQALTEIRDQILQQMDDGKRLAEDAWRRLEAKEHQRAEELFDQADQAYPGQERVQQGRQRIRDDEAEYRRLKSRAVQLDQADQAAGMDAYRGALEFHPELGRVDKLNERIEGLRLRLLRFERQKAQDAYEKGDYRLSLQLFEELLLRDSSDEEARLGRDKSISRLKVMEGQGLADEGHYQGARKLFQEALKLDSGNSEAKRLLALDDRYLSHLAEGRRLFSRSQKERSPQDCEQAIKHFQEARRLNAGRFGRERLDALLDAGDCKAVIPLPFERLASGLDSYLDGQPSDAIRHLEAALDEVGDGRAEVHALLGAAYCFSGLFQGRQDSALLEKGREQFRLALSADPEYRLSESLFSPRILRIFEEVRAKLQPDELKPSQPEPVPPGKRQRL